MPNAGQGGDDGGGGSSATEQPTVAQPPVAAVDLQGVLALITSAIGSEKPNISVRSYKLAETATARQLARYERSHVLNEETGQIIHKASALAQWQKQQVDAKLGAGRDRYVTGVRQPIISEDKEGNGFEYNKCYQLHTNERFAPLNSNGTILLEGAMRVSELPHVNTPPHT